MQTFKNLYFLSFTLIDVYCLVSNFLNNHTILQKAENNVYISEWSLDEALLPY